MPVDDPPAARAPASRSSTPTTTASTRSPTSTASATFYDAELRAVDRLVGDLLDVLPAGRGAAGHRRPRPGRRRRRASSARRRRARPHARASRARVGSAGCTPGPGAAADLLAAADGAPRRRRLGGQPRARSSTRAGSARWSARRSPARLGDVALVARDPISFDDPADTGPFQLVCRHGSLTSAEMLVPLLGRRRAD